VPDILIPTVDQGGRRYRLNGIYQKRFGVSYPSFKNYLKTLREILKRKHPDLAAESLVLADVCSRYGKLVGLSDNDIKTLSLAALYKNLGAIHLSQEALEQSFAHQGQTMTPQVDWLQESSDLAAMSGLNEVAIVLEQYHDRRIPAHRLARIFQVLNAWVICHKRQGEPTPINNREAVVELQQRAHLSWSDPTIVSHFLAHFPWGSHPYGLSTLPPLTEQRRSHQDTVVASSAPAG
jgi:hypothetical protein